MRKNIIRLLLVIFIISLFTMSVIAAPQDKQKVIVGFHDKPDVALVKAHGGDVNQEFTIINAIAAEVPEQAIKGLKNNPNIAYVEEDAMAYATEDTLPWGVDQVNAEVVFGGSEDAKDVTGTSGENVKVAVLDTGIDKDHPELVNNIYDGRNFVTKNGRFSGPIDPNDWEDRRGHGTHVSGTIAAIDNEEGVIGVAPKVDLLIGKVLGDDGSGYYSWMISGIEWAVANDADIISMSLGGSVASTALEDAVNNAYNSGVLIVAAAGNSGNTDGTGDSVEYPARYDSVIAVAATNSSDNRAYFSSTGSDVELSAPGVDVLSTYLNGGYATGSGTSMACPHVSGVAALVVSAGVTDQNNDGYVNDEIRQILRASTLTLGDGNWYGYGLVQADVAVSLVTPVDQPPVANAGEDQTLMDKEENGETVTLHGSGSTDDGSIVSYAWTKEGILVNTSPVFDIWLPIGVYTFGLNVTDDAGASDYDEVVINITQYVPQAPTADAGEDQTVTDDGDGFETVTLDGSGSTDDGNIVSYVWKEGETVFGTTEVTTFDFTVGTHTVTLTVTDDDGLSSTDTVVITVEPAPVASDITLSATGYKVKGRHSVDLSWTGATTTNVDIYRDGSIISTTLNDGFYVDNMSYVGNGFYTYQVCEEGTSTCSGVVDVIFG